MHGLIQQILPDLIVILGALIAASALVALEYVRKRFKLDLTAKQQEAIRGVVRSGIAFAEERAAARAGVSLGTEEKRQSSRLKAQEAADFISRNAPGLKSTAIDDLIVAELANANAGAVARNAAQKADMRG